MDEINNLRLDINSIDKEIINLMVSRKSLSDKIIAIKKSNNLSVYDKQRELEIISSLTREFGDLLNPHLIEKILREILFYSKSDSYRLSASNSNDLFALIDKLPILIAGPCTVESEEQLSDIAQHLNSNGVRFLRGGAFKPRTSPFSFQGLEDDGLKMMKIVAEKNNMFVVTEFTDSRQLDMLYDYADIIQVGSRNMFSYGFLKQIGKKSATDGKPILLKRGFNATLNEFLLSAQYVLNEGNPNVILCLRGIRTFEQIDSMMRNTPDLASILELKELTNLKVIFDPSHACGDSKFIVKASEAALNLGADGLLIETHNSPKDALTDGKQSIEPVELERIIEFINRNF